MERKDMEKKCKKAIDKLTTVVKKDSSVLLVVGNGISPKDLDTKEIVPAFIETFKNSERSKFREARTAFENLSEIFKKSESSGQAIDSAYDMSKFLKDLYTLKEANVKERFINYLIKKCCEARPNRKHFALLSFCSLLNDVSNGKDKVTIPRIFTTNYDNLIEKVYLTRKLFLAKNFPDLYKNNKDDFIRATETLLIPGFYLNLDDIDTRKGILSIIPIHNSIRITECPSSSCEEILKSEAVGLGEKTCIYCGQKVEEIIVPTEEGRINDRLLGLLKKETREAVAIIFVGYSLKDEYIKDAIRREIRNSSTKPVILNFCTDALPQDIRQTAIEKSGKENIFDITFSLPESLEYANSLLRKDTPLSQLFKKIDEARTSPPQNDTSQDTS